MPYFDKFQTVNYDVTGEGDYTLLTDFTPNFKVRIQNILRNVSYLNYIIDDGARPDVMSHYLYGTPEYYWTFFVVNDSLRLGERSWPLSDLELDSSISYKYDDYSIMSFNPLTVPNGTLGNMSCVPFKNDYTGLLRIVPIDEEGNEVDSYSIVDKYDYSSCQLSISRSIFSENNPISTSSFIDNYTHYKIKPILTDSRLESYRSEIAAAYGLSQSTSLTDDYLYEIAQDQYNHKLNWEYMRNAAYQYYTIDSVTSETLSLNGYDVLTASNINYEYVKFVMYSEKEMIENNRKKTISVVHPDNIVQFAKSYFDTLRNV